MHDSSFDHMRDLVDKYLGGKQGLQIIDIGSCDVNGSYRPLFDKPGWTYRGVDLAPGPNVDIILRSPYRFPLPANSIDLIVSGQAFEHIEYFWFTWLELVRILKPGGMIFLIAPSRGQEHRFPVDCWRFYPDGYRALAKYGDLELVEVSTDWVSPKTPDGGNWGDTVGAFEKPVLPMLKRVVSEARLTAARRLATLLGA